MAHTASDGKYDHDNQQEASAICEVDDHPSGEPVVATTATNENYSAIATTNGGCATKRTSPRNISHGDRNTVRRRVPSSFAEVLHGSAPQVRLGRSASNAQVERS
jgi:hypothetical protein